MKTVLSLVNITAQQRNHFKAFCSSYSVSKLHVLMNSLKRFVIVSWYHIIIYLMLRALSHINCLKNPAAEPDHWIFIIPCKGLVFNVRMWEQLVTCSHGRRRCLFCHSSAAVASSYHHEATLMRGVPCEKVIQSPSVNLWDLTSLSVAAT